MHAKQIIEQLQKQGTKITAARKLLVEIFAQNHLPLTEPELRNKLARAGVEVNKTTVYRQLELFLKLGIVKEVEFGDGKKRFEFNLHNHHHHLVCTNCQKVEDIFVHNDVKHVENKIAKLKKFQVKNHTLEFFGLCANCQK